MAVTPNMIIITPTINVTSVTDAASQINVAIDTIDSHDHSSGSGVKVTPAGMNVNADLDLNDNTLKAAHALEVTSLTSAITGASHANKLMSVNGELHFTDGAGVSVAITANGGIDTTTSGGWTGDYGSTDAEATYVDATKIFKLMQDGNQNQAGILDIGDIKLRTTTVGAANYISLKSPVLSSSYDITLPSAVPGSTSIMTMGATGIVANTRDPSVDTVSTTGAVTVGTTLGVTGTSTLGVTNTGALSSTTGTFSSTLGVTGTSTLGVTNTGALSSTTGTFSSTLGVTGTSTLGVVTVGGTLGVTGTSTLGVVTATTVNGVDPSALAARHITGGSDEIDGDKLDIDWTPSNYTPATTPSEADSVDNLTAHLYGIDQAIATKRTTGSSLSATTGTFSSTLGVTGTSTLGVTNTGVLTAASGTLTEGLTVGSNKDITLQGTGELNHGTFSLNISAVAGNWTGNTGTATNGYFNDGEAWAEGASNVLYIAIPLKVGDRIISIDYGVFGGSTGSKTAGFRKKPFDTTFNTDVKKNTFTTSGVITGTITPATPYTIITGESIFFRYTSGHADDRVYGIVVNYDHP